MGDKRNGAIAAEVLCEGAAKAGLLLSIVGPREMKWNGFVCECQL